MSAPSPSAVSPIPSPPAVRAILLGASNLKVGLPRAVDFLRRRMGAVEALTACGHGRSYGAWSRFLFVRRLPGILDCGLWRALDSRPELPTVGLVTDVGNDLAYGETLDRVAGWVAACLDRLSKRESLTILTLLPLASLEKLSPARFTAARSLLFPGRDISWPVLLDRAQRLDTVLRRLGRDWGAFVVEPELDWYGIDPIHVRRSRREAAWEKTLEPWGPYMPKPGPGVLQPWRAPAFGAHEYRLLNSERRTPQPVRRLADGTTLEMY